MTAEAHWDTRSALQWAREVLRVSPGASSDELKSAYRAAVRATHPDHTGRQSDDAFAEVQTAYEWLTATEIADGDRSADRTLPERLFRLSWWFDERTTAGYLPGVFVIVVLTVGAVAGWIAFVAVLWSSTVLILGVWAGTGRFDSRRLRRESVRVRHTRGARRTGRNAV